MTQLNDTDSKRILEYYNMEIPKSKRVLQNKAEEILATKLCRCIKKVDVKNEARSIGICTKTIINRKGYTRGAFKCKGKATLKLSKKTSSRKRK